MYSSSLNRYDPIFNVLQYALHPPAVIIVQKDMTLSYPSHVPSTRFPTGTVLALLAAFGFKDYHPYLSQYFSSCGSQYPETPGTFWWAGPITGYHLAWSILCIYNQAPKSLTNLGTPGGIRTRTNQLSVAYGI